MSRYSDYDDEEDYPGQFELYQANLDRALHGRKGRRFLADLREALMALPEHRLIEGALCTVGAAQRRAEMVAEAEAAAARNREYAEQHAAAGEPWAQRALEREFDPDWYLVEDLDDHVSRDGEGVCAIGALLWHQKVKAGEDPAAAFTSLPLVLGTEDGGLSETAAMAKDATGIASMVAWEVAYTNDETFAGCTPEERWQKFVDWVDKELAAEASA